MGAQHFQPTGQIRPLPQRRRGPPRLISVEKDPFRSCGTCSRRMSDLGGQVTRQFPRTAARSV